MRPTRHGRTDRGLSWRSAQLAPGGVFPGLETAKGDEDAVEHTVVGRVRLVDQREPVGRYFGLGLTVLPHGGGGRGGPPPAGGGGGSAGRRGGGGGRSPAPGGGVCPSISSRNSRRAIARLASPRRNVRCATR